MKTPLRSKMSRVAPLGCALLAFGLMLMGGAAEEAKAFQFQDPALHPGKSDFLYRHNKTTEEYNYIWWSPVFKGGAGMLDSVNAAPTTYSGGFFRPLVKRPQWGDLILGAQNIDTNRSDSFEFQGEYRFPFGLGLGGGLVERTASTQDVAFYKVSFRNKAAGLNYILEAQRQKIINKTSPGGYLALYNDQLMGVFGNDGEQWRTCVGYVAPKMNLPIRPSLEVLYVDNTPGQINGTQFLFINGTLGFEGGFLSHPARLGRAMGPTGLEYGNPLGFLAPTFNRQLNTWELGQMADFRLNRQRFPNGTVQETWEGLVFPAQFLRVKNLLAGLFVGAFYAKVPTPSRDSSGPMAGFSRGVGPILLSLQGDYNLDTYEKRTVVGIINKF